MPRRVRAPVITQPQMRSLLLGEFRGGWNIRDAAEEVELNESPDTLNFTINERGGVEKRLGVTKVNASAMAGTSKNGMYAKSLDTFAVQIGQDIYTTADFVTFTKRVVGAAANTFTTSATCGMCEFAKQIVFVHPIDGIFVWDGTTMTNPTATVKGDSIAAWQNKCWASGTGNTDPSIVWWSNAGTASTWTTASDFVSLREKDDTQVRALGGGQGMDVAGRPGLLAFKEESTYRINSSSTGAFTTIDADRGASGPLAVTTLADRTLAVSKHGLWSTDGTSHMADSGSKVKPLFTASGISMANMHLAAAGIWRDRIVCSFPRAGASVNNLVLEYSPIDGWVMPHNLAANWFANYSKDASKLFGGKTNGSYIYNFFDGGTDDGTAITCRFQTSWISPSVLTMSRLRRLRLIHRGSFSVYVKADFDSSDGTQYLVVESPSGAAQWDSGVDWDSGADWAAVREHVYSDLYSLGHCKHVSFVFRETGSTTTTSLPILGDGNSPTVGAVAVFGLRLDFVPLGLA